MHVKDYICLAHDTSSFEEIKHFADLLHPFTTTSKLGLEVMSAPRTFASALEYLKSKHRKVFVDGKFNDIPETVGRAVACLANEEVDMCTVHGGGPQGTERLQAAVEQRGNMEVFAVTVLTSVERKKDVGMPVTTQVLYTALRALQAGVDGIICSAQDLDILNRSSANFSAYKRCTPGIRLPGSPTDDQKRTMTPGEAIAAGSDLLVIGRPFTDQRYNNNDPTRTAQFIHTEVQQSLIERGFHTPF